MPYTQLITISYLSLHTSQLVNILYTHYISNSCGTSPAPFSMRALVAVQSGSVEKREAAAYLCIYKTHILVIDCMHMMRTCEKRV